MAITSDSIVGYVKANYPKIVFKPFKLPYKNAVGFIVSGGQLIVGYIDKDGNLQKLIEPVDTNSLSSADASAIIKNIPSVEGFSEGDKKELMKIFDSVQSVITRKEHNAVVAELKNALQEEESKYRLLFDKENDEVIMIKKEYQEKIDEINSKFQKQKIKLEQCKASVVQHKEQIIKNIKEYQDKINAFAKDNSLKSDELRKLHAKVKSENEALQTKLEVVLESERNVVSKIQQCAKRNDEIQALYEKVSKENAKLNELLQRTRDGDQSSALQDQNNKLQKKLEELLEREEVYLIAAKRKAEETEAMMKQGVREKEKYNALLELYDTVVGENENLNTSLKELTQKMQGAPREGHQGLQRQLQEQEQEQEQKQEQGQEQEQEQGQQSEELLGQLQGLREDNVKLQAALEDARRNVQTDEQRMLYENVIGEKRRLEELLRETGEKGNFSNTRVKELEEQNGRLQNEIAMLLAREKDVLEESARKLEEYKEFEERSKAADQEYQALLASFEKLKEENARLNANINDTLKQKSQDESVVANNLENLLMEMKAMQDEIRKKDDLARGLDETLKTKEEDLIKLERSVKEITDQLNKTGEELLQTQIKASTLEGYTDRCKEKLLNEKETIKNAILDYNAKWSKHVENMSENYDAYKKQMLAELDVIRSTLKAVLADKDRNTSEENSRLKSNVKEIEAELYAVISKQVEQLNVQSDKIQQLEQQRNLHLQALDEQKRESGASIVKLQKELEEVKRLLMQNNNSVVKAGFNYDSCLDILQNFFALNNIFYRKGEVIKKLDSIINTQLGSFVKLPDTAKASVGKQYEEVRGQIMRHIEFLDLKRYTNSTYLTYLKSKSTQSKVPEEFCEELSALLDYWNENKGVYREQDRILTNIYEDLSGAVRVYVRIKPLIGTEQRDPTVYIQTVEQRKQKSIILDCTSSKTSKYNKKEIFGEYYGVFEEYYTNQDVYSGNADVRANHNSLNIDIDNLQDSSDTVSPGLYSAFKQVEDGYSIVLFGYGASGSGKTFTLLGSEGIPGVLHYGLANLSGVQNIKLKYLFEQYYSAVDVNFGKVRAKIHNLVREVPQMRKFAKDENAQFIPTVPANINLNNLKIDDLYGLTAAIDTYRIQKGRIKRTPNNPVSSRSHLYFVFEIQLEKGKTGYVTIVDTAGRESPIDIYETFIDTSKTQLGSIMAPSGGENLIGKTMRPEIKEKYTPKEILEVLREGFYINESINHLVYFFNVKNYKKTDVYLQSTNPEKYNVSRFYVKPSDEEKIISDVNNCLTVPIMKFLDSLADKNRPDAEWRPTKFITILAVRQENKYCDQTFSTLEFAQSVKST
jgi:hypothetical protein